MPSCHGNKQHTIEEIKPNFANLAILRSFFNNFCTLLQLVHSIILRVQLLYYLIQKN